MSIEGLQWTAMWHDEAMKLFVKQHWENRMGIGHDLKEAHDERLAQTAKDLNEGALVKGDVKVKGDTKIGFFGPWSVQTPVPPPNATAETEEGRLFWHTAIDKYILFTAMSPKDGSIVIEIWVDKDGNLHIDGNLDEGAKQFAKYLGAHFQAVVGGRDGL